MGRLLLRSSGILAILFLLPSMVLAQAAITGVVKDASGGVLPGATVEAASPVLIEKVRAVVSDETGQYRIVDLRPGTYSVTFSLPGFSTVKREGIELTGAFVATVNGDLKVGALEETITVTGETPIVDVQSAKVQQTVTKEVLAAIPTSRNASGVQALIPGLITRQAGVSVAGGDAGGIQGGMGGQAGTIHGGSGQSGRTKNDGLNTAFTGQQMGGGQLVNVAGAQEVVVSTSGGLGEAEAGGVILDIIPREGGNTFSGTFNASGSGGGMQGSNYTQSLKDQGLRAPSDLIKLYDINPMGGGRIVRDKLWFYLTYRQVVSENTIPGMFVNKNAGDPNKWTVDLDQEQQAYKDTLDRNGIGRITYQATQRNKFTAHWSEQFNTIYTKGGGGPTATPEAVGRSIFHPSHVQQVTWSSPLTSRMLLEAGFGTYLARYTGSEGGGPRVDGTYNPAMIRVQEQGGAIPGLFFRQSAADNGGFGHHTSGTREWRASMSYVTGAHNMKFGYQGGYTNPTFTNSYAGEIILIRMNNGVINRLTQVAMYPAALNTQNNVMPVGFYAQDQWTRDRLTLQGGIRFDNAYTSYPTHKAGGPGYNLMPTEIVYPAGTTPGIDWHDITPRMGVAYDLFGNGRTALKMNLGKYMEGLSSLGGFAVQLSPLNRLTTTTTRAWLDTNQNYVPDCNLINPAKNGECGQMDDQNFGKEVFTQDLDPSLYTGWGSRPYNWSLGLSVQHQIVPRVSATVGYHRNWWGNQAMVDNRSTNLVDYTPFGIRAPLDSRLPGGGGQTISGLYNLVPERVGQVSNLTQHLKNFSDLTENWHGVDLGVMARLRNGLTVQGGTSTGRRLTDTCALRDIVPEQNFAGGSVTNPYCHVVEPFATAATGLATYPIPKVDVQVSLTWQSKPGPSLAANYVANNAVIASGPLPLGRPLSGGAANVTVNLIEPNTFFAPRQNNFDVRVAKIFRYGRTRTQIGLDLYNLTNTDVVVGFNQTFVPGGPWLTPTQIQPARYIKISGQFDF